MSVEDDFNTKTSGGLRIYGESGPKSTETVKKLTLNISTERTDIPHTKLVWYTLATVF